MDSRKDLSVEARDGSRLTVVTLADENYAIPLAVMGRSLLDSLPAQASALLCVIDGGLSETTKRRLAASWQHPGLAIEFVPPQYGGEEEVPVWGHMPPLTYARIFLPEYLPNDCSKGIFLDSDTIVLKNLEHLWEIDLRGFHLAAVQDPTIPYAASVNGLAECEKHGIAPETPFFNAGVMLVNTELWRTDDTPRKAMRFVREHGAKLHYCDQDALNAVLFDRWLPLDPRWQVQPRFVNRPGLPMPHLDDGMRQKQAADPWIIHASGRLKPWVYHGHTEWDRLFSRFLDRTEWRGWRPSRDVRSLVFRLYDSPLRDFCYPLEQRANGLWRKLQRRMAPVAPARAQGDR